MRILWPSEYSRTVAARALFKGWYAPGLPVNRFLHPRRFTSRRFRIRPCTAIVVGAAGSAAGIEGGGAIGAGAMGARVLAWAVPLQPPARGGFRRRLWRRLGHCLLLGAAFFFGAAFALLDFPFAFAFAFAFIGRDFFFAALFLRMCVWQRRAWLLPSDASSLCAFSTCSFLPWSLFSWEIVQTHCESSPEKVRCHL